MRAYIVADNNSRDLQQQINAACNNIEKNHGTILSITTAIAGNENTFRYVTTITYTNN